eukprot:Pgem_evm1s3563
MKFSTVLFVSSTVSSVSYAKDTCSDYILDFSELTGAKRGSSYSGMVIGDGKAKDLSIPVSGYNNQQQCVEPMIFDTYIPVPCENLNNINLETHYHEMIIEKKVSTACHVKQENCDHGSFNLIQGDQKQDGQPTNGIYKPDAKCNGRQFKSYGAGQTDTSFIRTRYGLIIPNNPFVSGDMTKQPKYDRNGGSLRFNFDAFENKNLQVIIEGVALIDEEAGTQVSFCGKDSCDEIDYDQQNVGSNSWNYLPQDKKITSGDLIIQLPGKGMLNYIKFRVCDSDTSGPSTVQGSSGDGSKTNIAAIAGGAAAGVAAIAAGIGAAVYAKSHAANMAAQNLDKMGDMTPDTNFNVNSDFATTGMEGGN